MIDIVADPGSRIRQGDIFREVEHLQSFRQEEEFVEISKIFFPLIIVLTQDCDLEQNKVEREKEDESKRDKHLISVLVAPLYNSEHLFLGEHLQELEQPLTMERINSRQRRLLKKNQTPRYHYLEFPQECRIVNSVIDFKHYFSLSLSYLETIYEDQFMCSVGPLYRESISQRFSNYLSRIGLPGAKEPV